MQEDWVLIPNENMFCLAKGNTIFILFATGNIFWGGNTYVQGKMGEKMLFSGISNNSEGAVILASP